MIYADGVEAESFHPNARTIAAMSPDQKAELLALFPKLETDQGFAYEAALPELRRKDGRLLAT